MPRGPVPRETTNNNTGNREAKKMDSYLKYLGREAALGRISRREFLGRAAVVGLTLPFATTLLSSSLLAAGPQRGGHLKVGLQGGASTDVLDPDRKRTRLNSSPSCASRMP